MSTHTVKILESRFITHDVKRIAVEKPKGYKFFPGQATDVSINASGWTEQLRPFTFTSLEGWDNLEFTIKIYNSHHGVTEQLGKLNAGAELLLHDVFGAIQYKGPGVFIAGGAGVTPFIAILRSLYLKNQLEDNLLLFSNKTAEDLILNEEFTRMLGERFVKIFTRENVIGFREKRIDRDYLIETVQDFSRHFYVCGPDAFVQDISKLLLDLGATADTVIFEK